MIDDKTLERVKKMINLGNNEGATEAERATALRMAYNILAKHNLSLADLPDDAPTEARERQDVVISADRWSRNLASAVSKLFFCKYFFGRTNVSGKDLHCFVGLQSNAITARYMTEYLVKSIKREATARYKSATSPQGRSFCVGTVAAIAERVNEMLTTESAEVSSSTSVALTGMHKREAEANAKWLAEQGVTLETGVARRDNALRASAFFNGKDYGQNVSLNHQVSQKSDAYKKLA